MIDNLVGIGILARETGTSVQTVRYYESRGLLPAPPRTEGGQRRYGRLHRDRLAFIRHAREMGFALDAIGELLRLSKEEDASCGPVDRIAREQLQLVDRRIEQLCALRETLSRMIDRCDGESVTSCRILEALGPSQNLPASGKDGGTGA
ncbi:MerR family transcriptional regulator [Stappia sediminis]|uniref:MerR family transcriptional regulator n=1 Tax=Stappia sediminis TaxID=2692190 RepID=UPI0028AF9DDC|nr:helix-turn-helix domain-containing protein [Stappia sediminis]